MKEKGFTLMELLAVLVILGIILGITLPKVTQTLERANQDTLKENAESLLSVVKKTYLDYAGSELYFDVESPILMIDGVSQGELDYNGSLPKKGWAKVGRNGVACIAVSDGTYCAYKVDEVEPIAVEEISPEDCIAKVCQN